MKRVRSASKSANEVHGRETSLLFGRGRSPGICFRNGANVRSILVTSAALCLICNCAFGQTTRTGPSSASTVKSIPSASSTSPNNPCDSTNPTSPCYSAGAPRNPCYSAVSPNEPCSTTTTPNSQALPPPPPPVAVTTRATERAFTADQAKSQIEADGYSNVSGLRKDAKGQWQGKAMKDGSPVSVTIDADGKIAPK
jgi:periplasmic protein CpxP/Spy